MPKKADKPTELAILAIQLVPSPAGGHVYVKLADGSVREAISANRHVTSALIATAENAPDWPQITPSQAAMLFPENA